VTACGALAEHGTEPFRLACLVGLLRHVVGAGVNFVNAPLVARERGIRVLESVEDESIYHDGHLLLRLEGVNGGGASVRGALFGRTPYLTRIDGVHVDLEPKGAILVTRHEDRPGVLGRIGTVLGEHGVNILRVDLGRPSHDQGALASAYLSVDKLVGKDVLDDLRRIEPIRWVSCVRL
jgi:D-3-phosphoglycerate dehydrogenase